MDEGAEGLLKRFRELHAAKRETGLAVLEEDLRAAIQHRARTGSKAAASERSWKVLEAAGSQARVDSTTKGTNRTPWPAQVWGVWRSSIERQPQGRVVLPGRRTPVSAGP